MNDMFKKVNNLLKDSDWLLDSIPEHNSRPPLRWIANWCGNIASGRLLSISYMEDDGYTGWRWHVNSFLWNNLWPIYNKYGTFYRLRMPLSDYTWDYVDEETDDAFRIIYNDSED